MQGKLEHELGGRSDAELAPGLRRHQVQVFLDCLEDRVRVQIDVAHHLREGVPLNLSEREEEMFICERGVLSATRLLDRPIDDALRGFSDFAGGDVEVFYLHACLLFETEQDVRQWQGVAERPQFRCEDRGGPWRRFGPPGIVVYS